MTHWYSIKQGHLSAGRLPGTTFITCEHASESAGVAKVRTKQLVRLRIKFKASLPPERLLGEEPVLGPRTRHAPPVARAVKRDRSTAGSKPPCSVSSAEKRNRTPLTSPRVFAVFVRMRKNPRLQRGSPLRSGRSRSKPPAGFPALRFGEGRGSARNMRATRRSDGSDSGSAP